MFALGDILKFDCEKGAYKILKPIWVVITDRLILFLAALSIVFGGMQLTSGTFVCLAAVDCPGMSRVNMSSSWFSNMKHRNACEKFYSTQKSKDIPGTVVLTDLGKSIYYANFVNSECSKSAVPGFLSYFGFVLFLQALVLMVFNNLWLIYPDTASVIGRFVSLVMECYASPCPNFALAHALSDLPHHADDQQLVGNNMEMANIVSNNDNDNDNDHDHDHDNESVDEDEDEIPVSISDDEIENDESYDVSILEDPATISAIKSLYEKVDTLKKNIKSSTKIWRLYLYQAISQFLCILLFLLVNFSHKNVLKEEMTCRLTQHIPVIHDNFICSHNLAPTFALGLTWFYLPTLQITGIAFVLIILGMLMGWYRKFEYVFDAKKLPSLKATILSDVPPVDQDLGFLLLLLHFCDKSYVVRFAHFLSEKSKSKVQTFCLRKSYPATKLRKQLRENGNKLTFTDIRGIPETIFKLRRKIVKLEFLECKLQNDDFKEFFYLTNLRKLSIIQCRLKSIPEGILNIKCLEELILKGNFLTNIDSSIRKLEHLATLDLSNNKIKTIQPQSCENIDNLFKVCLLGNPKLEIQALKVVLACKRLHILYSPPQLFDRINELNPLEREKFNAVSVAASGEFVIPYTSRNTPHIDIGDYEKIYKMDSCPKGIALIINNYLYQKCPGLSDRTGSEKDLAMLKSVFEKIGFYTFCCIDKTPYEAKNFVKEYTESKKFKDCDCIVVFVMSHGSESGLIFPNGETLNVMCLVDLVQKSKFYQEKPKLFFIQANWSNSLATTADALSSPMTTELPPIPEKHDILLSYSSMELEGFSSYRNMTYGSWYVQALVETLCEHAWEEDILSLLTLVNYKVVRHFSQAGWRKVPAPQSTLRKKLYLLPGYSK